MPSSSSLYSYSTLSLNGMFSALLSSASSSNRKFIPAILLHALLYLLHLLHFIISLVSTAAHLHRTIFYNSAATARWSTLFQTKISISINLSPSCRTHCLTKSCLGLQNHTITIFFSSWFGLIAELKNNENWQRSLNLFKRVRIKETNKKTAKLKNHVLSIWYVKSTLCLYTHQIWDIFIYYCGRINNYKKPIFTEFE